MVSTFSRLRDQASGGLSVSQGHKVTQGLGWNLNLTLSHSKSKFLAPTLHHSQSLSQDLL